MIRIELISNPYGKNPEYFITYVTSELPSKVIKAD